MKYILNKNILLSIHCIRKYLKIFERNAKFEFKVNLFSLTVNIEIKKKKFKEKFLYLRLRKISDAMISFQKWKIDYILEQNSMRNLY
jgi:hypothetical protein